MGWWHDKNDNSMNVGDSRSVVAARPHLREVVQQRRGSRSVAAASGADSGAPRVAAREGGGRRGLLLLRPSYWRLGSGGCGEQADTGIAATAGTTRQLCAPVVQQQQERQGAQSACVLRSEGVAVDTVVRLRQRNQRADAPLQGLLQDIKAPMAVVAS